MAYKQTHHHCAKSHQCTNKHTTIFAQILTKVEKFSPKCAPRCEGVCRAWRQEVQHLVASGKLQRQVVLQNCFGAFDNPFEQPEWLAVPMNNFSPPSFEPQFV